MKVYDFNDLLAKNLHDEEFRKHYHQAQIECAIGFKIFETRQIAKLTPAELAAKSGISQSKLVMSEMCHMLT
jgi:hypothetical protein